MNKKLLVKLLRNFAEDIEKDKCGLDDEEILELFEAVSHRKLTIEQAAQRYGVSRATLYRWVSSGKLPKIHKDPGGKEYMWTDECDKHLKDNNK